MSARCQSKNDQKKINCAPVSSENVIRKSLCPTPGSNSLFSRTNPVLLLATSQWIFCSFPIFRRHSQIMQPVRCLISCDWQGGHGDRMRQCPLMAQADIGLRGLNDCFGGKAGIIRT